MEVFRLRNGPPQALMSLMTTFMGRRWLQITFPLNRTKKKGQIFLWGLLKAECLMYIAYCLYLPTITRNFETNEHNGIHYFCPQNSSTLAKFPAIE